jgi:hypothetical protein
MTAVYICECGHPKSQHKREREGCRSVECAGACSKFVADMKASTAAQGVDRTRVLTAVAEVCEDQAAKARAELGPQPIPQGWVPPERRADAERLAKAERERDELSSALDQVGSDLKHSINALAAVIVDMDERRAERDLARAELVSVRQENEQLHGLVARVEQAAGIDRERDRGVDLADRVQSIRDGRTEAISHFVAVAGERDVLASHQRYLCETCGARYGIAYTDHEHGPLTPVTVTITRQGAPTA